MQHATEMMYECHLRLEKEIFGCLAPSSRAGDRALRCRWFWRGGMVLHRGIIRWQEEV